MYRWKNKAIFHIYHVINPSITTPRNPECPQIKNLNVLIQ